MAKNKDLCHNNSLICNNNNKNIKVSKPSNLS